MVFQEQCISDCGHKAVNAYSCQASHIYRGTMQWQQKGVEHDGSHLLWRQEAKLSLLVVKDKLVGARLAATTKVRLQATLSKLTMVSFSH